MMAVHSTRNGVPPEGYVLAGTPEPGPVVPEAPPVAEPEPEPAPAEEPAHEEAPEQAAEPERQVPRRTHHGKR